MARHQPELPGRLHVLGPGWVTAGATLSILNGPALIPEVQFPAMSHTWPDAIMTADPFVIVDLLKEEVFTPEVSSEAPNVAVSVPRHQSEFPGRLQVLGPGFKTVGAMLSILNGPALIPELQFPARSQ